MKKFAVLVALLLATSLSWATPIRAVRSPVAVVGNTMGEYEERWYPEENMINKSGLVTPFIDGVTDFWDLLYSPSLHQGWDDYSWLSAYQYTGDLVFDMGRAYLITNLMMWNGATGIDASPARFTVSTSLTRDFAQATVVGSFAGHMMHYYGTGYTLDESVGRYVKLSIDGNFGNYCCVAIGEVAFETELLHPIPEPDGLALGAAGTAALAAAALARRTRRRRA